MQILRQFHFWRRLEVESRLFRRKVDSSRFSYRSLTSSHFRVKWVRIADTSDSKVYVSRRHVAHNVRSSIFRQHPFQPKASSMIDLLYNHRCYHCANTNSGERAFSVAATLVSSSHRRLHRAREGKGELPPGKLWRWYCHDTVNDISPAYLQWLKCNGTQGNAVPLPPIYSSKRSPPQIVIMLGKGTWPLLGAQTWL